MAEKKLYNISFEIFDKETKDRVSHGDCVISSDKKVNFKEVGRDIILGYFDSGMRTVGLKDAIEVLNTDLGESRISSYLLEILKIKMVCPDLNKGKPFYVG